MSSRSEEKFTRLEPGTAWGERERERVEDRILGVSSLGGSWGSMMFTRLDRGIRGSLRSKGYNYPIAEAVGRSLNFYRISENEFWF